MDLEKLSKQQIVLLTLLVSFVTSIATGIVTVSLLDQAPKAVTQTINRVVEKTVERIVPQPAAVIKQGSVERPTPAPTEDELTVAAIEGVKKKIVRIFSVPDAGIAKGRFLSLGFATKGGVVVSDPTFISPYTNYLAEVNGVEVAIRSLGPSETSGPFALFRVSDNDKAKIGEASFVVLPKNSDVKLGQKVIAVGGSGEPIVHIGIVSSIKNENEGSHSTTTETAKIIGLSTDFSSGSLLPMTPLLALDGRIIAIKMPENFALAGGPWSPFVAVLDFIIEKLSPLGVDSLPKQSN